MKQLSQIWAKYSNDLLEPELFCGKGHFQKILESSMYIRNPIYSEKIAEVLTCNRNTATVVEVGRLFPENINFLKKKTMIFTRHKK